MLIGTAHSKIDLNTRVNKSMAIVVSHLLYFIERFHSIGNGIELPKTIRSECTHSGAPSQLLVFRYIFCNLMGSYTFCIRFNVVIPNVLSSKSVSGISLDSLIAVIISKRYHPAVFVWFCFIFPLRIVEKLV